MVMYFKSETVLDFLLRNGKVYTLRKHKRKKTGKDWITLGKLGPEDPLPPLREKIADVIIKEIGLVDLATCKVFSLGKEKTLTLQQFVNESSFYNVDSWIEAYRFFAGKKTTQAWLYEVTLLKIHGLEGG
jgi:hypothetical protein